MFTDPSKHLARGNAAAVAEQLLGARGRDGAQWAIDTKG
jgi:hypothetical protein